MNIENNYPSINKKINYFLLIKKVVGIIFIISFICCLIVNLSLGGSLWCFYVLFGEVILYFIFFKRFLVDNIMIYRVCFIFLLIIIYFYYIDLINNTNWSFLVNDILIYILLLLQIISFFINYNYHKYMIVMMLFSSLCSIIIGILSILRVLPFNWAIIVSFSLAIIVLVMLFVFYHKLAILELKKYFSLK